MNHPLRNIQLLVVGATGSVGTLVVDEAIRQGHSVRALVRDARKAAALSKDAELCIGDVTRAQSLSHAVDGVDAVVLTLGSDGQGRAGAESVDYGGVRNVLAGLGTRRVHIALMSSIGVTDRTGTYNRSTQAHDWKRRAERLVRASGHPYTIVRPGWFDANTAGQQRVVLLQGDRRRAGNPSDGVVARRRIAEVLVASLTAPEAVRKTFELVSEDGAPQRQFGPLFAALEADAPGALDGVHDLANMPLDDEPAHVRRELESVFTADVHFA